MWWRSTGDHWSLARLLTFVTTIIRDDDTPAVMCHLSTLGFLCFLVDTEMNSQNSDKAFSLMKESIHDLIKQTGDSKTCLCSEILYTLVCNNFIHRQFVAKILKTTRLWRSLRTSIKEVQVETPFYKKALVGIFYYTDIMFSSQYQCWNWGPLENIPPSLCHNRQQ